VQSEQLKISQDVVEVGILVGSVHSIFHKDLNTFVNSWFKKLLTLGQKVPCQAHYDGF
jgi:hypothetical protein